MDLTTFHSLLARKKPDGRGHDLYPQQKEAVEHDTGPLWLLAGPGSGKTEVLVTRTLKLLCVDRVPARSIMVTTFTKKAGRNLEDRLAQYLSTLQAADPSLKDVDLADLRVGTIHSLCNDILQEYRYPGYQNVRLLDEVEQNLFLYRRAQIANHTDLEFWRAFAYAVPEWHENSDKPPGKWKRVRAAVTLFNHIVEDNVDLLKMRSQGEHWETLADFYEQYVEALKKEHRCDFAHLQARFLDFLSSPGGQRFLDGDGKDKLPLLHVLIDEYQDTNPIQERIYLALAQRAPHNLTVVGDDDQALYRFRGATVSCMVHFDKACAPWGVSPKKIQLDRNYRSHPMIVDFFNDYIESFPEMNEPGVRAPGKTKTQAFSDIKGAYPAVSWLRQDKAGDLGDALAAFIQDHLLGDGIIEDLSQCVLLMRSTKDSPHNAGPFLRAFEARGIPVYNPRSKSFMESEEVKCLLGVLVHIIDRDFAFKSNNLTDLSDTVQDWVDTAVWLSDEPSAEPLIKYVEKSIEKLPELCKEHAGTFLPVTLLDILYRILAHEPFKTWRTDPVRNMRLSKVTRLFESYHSMNLDRLTADPSGDWIDPQFVDRFYNVLVGYLIDAGINDDEDEEVIVPRGHLPLMTIHQSKGLEFPFVFVTQVGGTGRVGAAQRLEVDLASIRRDLYPRSSRTPDLLAMEDNIRLLYVAYSRAQHGLILVGTPAQLKKNEAVPGRDFTAFRKTITTI